ncbi:MAG: tRNA (guanosine(37)-N1)-methyltransferase TrmD [Mycoplasmataceae bacterium]|jgi:tRNA (guanine37-N1)-methyltransferase|nr:tRNA (guanosine(37)-N1)-methyltransferase TrmD [Mycoplasmataceae bacterium]
MRITVLTLFPKLFDNFLTQSIVKRIIQKKLVKIEIIDFRKYSKSKTKRVDDYQYGGGPGMVIGLTSIVRAIKKYKTQNSKVILLSPQGKTYTQALAKTYKQSKHLILIAGHYEGFDERLLHYVDEVVSIGDYVLTGGEVPIMVIIESVIRLLDYGINKKSLDHETFDQNLLDYPIYTKPLVFEGHQVPKVLLSGNHKLIKAYRLQAQINKTKKYRKDMYKQYLKEYQNDKIK